MNLRVAALAFLVACAPFGASVDELDVPAMPHVDFVVDDTFTALEAADVRRAASAWNARTSRHIAFVDDADAWRTAHPDAQLWSILKAQVPSDYCGRSDNARRLVRADPDCASDRVYGIALHEFGHALGLSHTSTGVMRAPEPELTFTPEVMSECRRAGACP